jgi:hypothetical protein
MYAVLGLAHDATTHGVRPGYGPTRKTGETLREEGGCVVSGRAVVSMSVTGYLLGLRERERGRGRDTETDIRHAKHSEIIMEGKHA